MEPLIEAKNLKKAYDDRVVLDIEHIGVNPDEILTILGPSGCGKSVLLRLLNLLEAPTSGRILFEGREVLDLDRNERAAVTKKMAMLFQDPLLFSTTIYKNIAYGLKIRKVHSVQIEEKDTSFYS